MKNYLPFLILLLGAWLSFSSCSSTANVRVPYQVAPAVILPDHVQSVAVVDRSRGEQDRSGKVLTAVEGILSGEGLYEDRNGALACLTGAQTQLNIDNFVSAKVVDSLALVGTGTGMMPLPLAWGQVENLCKEHGVDALLVLEVFDTDQGGSSTTNAIGQIVSIAQTGNVNPGAVNTNSRVRVKMAWRMYDPREKLILDEVRMNDYFGVNSGTALGIYDPGEFAKRDAIQQSGYYAGRAYSARMFPTFRSFWRPFFIRKGQEMKKARRQVDVNRLDRAMETWEALTDNPKRKIGGRACFNMAVGHEILGDLPTAKQWADRAYTEFRVKRARDYARSLQRRMNNGF